MVKTLIILGPTAVGKTAVSILAAEKLGGEIVSADAFQVYRGMDIATAKPSPEELTRVPHHLVDILDPGEEYSAARFRELALGLIEEIKGRGAVPIVSGGAGMYIRVLVDGIFPSPPADRELRERLRAEEAERGPGYLHGRLARRDPVSAERIHPRNLKRIIRALEVLELTGTAISSLQREWGEAGDGAELPFLLIGLNRERANLYARIDRRAKAMFEGGLLEETRGLLETGRLEAGPARLALGYREATGCLRGEYGEEEAVRRLAAATRRFARRQLTWWRKEPRIEWIDLAPGTLPGEAAEKIVGLYARA
ncbi:MAG: tRNA (adenosine(37)-N6)-dimethylallyltransferase MiaA [Candidatus Erginobacter occultus]|nr:tRNA (adenosine(37)-N6)-dimethylallyltransferase MiaA [Candidatus Erginobacter occultus]